MLAPRFSVGDGNERLLLQPASAGLPSAALAMAPKESATRSGNCLHLLVTFVSFRSYCVHYSLRLCASVPLCHNWCVRSLFALFVFWSACLNAVGSGQE